MIAVAPYTANSLAAVAIAAAAPYTADTLASAIAAVDQTPPTPLLLLPPSLLYIRRRQRPRCRQPHAANALAASDYACNSAASSADHARNRSTSAFSDADAFSDAGPNTDALSF